MGKKIVYLKNFIKLEHTVFSLPLVYAGAVLGLDSFPSVKLFFLIFFALTGARAAAFTFNRILDRDIDKLNPRTSARELPSGKILLKEAYLVAIVGLVIYFYCAWLISKLCFLLSPIPVIFFVVYPYTKRFTTLSHFFLGLTWSMAPLAGFIATENLNIPIVLPLVIFSILWLTGFDIIYSTLDEKFDREFGLHSLPAKIGTRKSLKISFIFHFIGLIFLSFYIFYLKNRLIACTFFF